MDLQAQAAQYLAQGEYNQAIAIYQQCVEDHPNIISNYWWLGLALLLKGEELAAQSLWLSVIAEGTFEQIDTWTLELKQILKGEARYRIKINDFEQAEKLCWQIVELDPDDIEAYTKLSDIYIQQNKLEAAIDCYQRIITINPNLLDVYYNLGLAFQKQNQLDSAIECYKHIIHLDPKYIDAYYNLGTISYNQKKFKDAIDYYQKILEINSDSIESYYSLGLALQKQDQLEAAINCYQKITQIDPNSIDAYYQLGSIFQKQNKLESALEHYQKVLTINPNHINALTCLGTIYENKGEFEKAITYHTQALKIDPNFAVGHWNLALVLLRMGNFQQGFAEYEWRWRWSEFIENHAHVSSFSQPIWDGSNLNGKKILIYTEQGFGDTIQFIRYLPLVAQHQGQVIFWSPTPLARLAQTVPGISELIYKGKKLPDFQVRAPLMSLPYILGTTLETIPSQIPYLKALESSIKLTAPADKVLKVGIVWAGRSTHSADFQRSCNLSDFGELLNTPGIAFYSLQTGSRAEDLNQLPNHICLQDLSNHLNDFADTATVISQLDLVITVDTAVAHLAGALGKPVWVLLCFVPDWRWMLEREDSPWYPSMRLFRQRHSGDWQDVFRRVGEALEMLKKATQNLHISNGDIKFQ